VGIKTYMDYSPEATALVKQACLQITTYLQDFMEEDIVIVGGLVPTLIVDLAALPTDTERHSGTMDIDLGFSLALLGNPERYHRLADRLRKSGFAPDKNEKGNPSPQRWCYKDTSLTIDFLISGTGIEGGKVAHIEDDFAAIEIPGLSLAFESPLSVLLEDETLEGELARRTVKVCNPGAYVVLKALAFRNRGNDKDAYDLYYVVRNFNDTERSVTDYFNQLPETVEKAVALTILSEDFASEGHLGPKRIARFLGDPNNDEILADATGFIQGFIKGCN